MNQPQRLALFDFDGTVCSGNTLHLFIARQARGAEALRLGLWAVRRKLRLAGTRAFKEGILRGLRGLTEAELAERGRELYAAQVRPRLRPGALRELAEVRATGHRVMVVTGAFDFLIQPFCDEFAIVDCLCCRLERSAGRVTGHIAGGEMLGPDKPDAVRAHLGPESAIDWAGSRAYTDDWRDLPFLEMVGNRYLVGGTHPEAAAHRVVPLDWS